MNDNAKFQSLLDDYNQLIYKICYMYATDSDDLSDLYQEVCASLWQGLSSFNNRSKMSTWVYRVAVNTCISFIRKNSRHSQCQPLDFTSLCLVDDSVEHAEQLRQMYEMISMLGPLDKALILYWLDDYAYDEIASLTGLTRANVASRIHRIKKRLVSYG